MTVEFGNEEINMEDKYSIRKNIFIKRDTVSNEFPTLAIYFEVDGPQYKELYIAHVSVNDKIIKFAQFDYENRSGYSFYVAHMDFDINKFEFSYKVNDLQIEIEFDHCL